MVTTAPSPWPFCVIVIPAFVAAVWPAAPVKSTSPPGKNGMVIESKTR